MTDLDARRRRRRSTALAASAQVLGAIAIAVGVGFGIPHLAKTGATVETVAGIVLLVGGLALFAAGVAVVMRTALGWWRVPILLISVVGLLMVVLVLGQAVAATNVPRTELGSDTPADRGLEFRDVSFRTTDRVRLSGWYIPTVNGAAVALVHGAGSTRSSVLDHATVLAAHGYGVLLFDARGHGRSDGQAMDFGWYGNEDVSGAVSFLERAAGVDRHRVAVVGLSMGGEEAIGAMAADPRIAAVVAEGATNRVPADKGWLATEFGWRGRLQQGLEWFVYNTADLLTSAHQPVSLRAAAAAAAPRPVLLIAAGANPDEAHAARFIRRASPGTVEIWVAEKAGHTDALATYPVEWEARVTRFLTNVFARRT